GPFGVPGVEVRVADSTDEERRHFERLAAAADATLVIAPEFDGLLEARSRLVAACGGRSVGPTPGAIALCGDKLALARHLGENGVPTIETQPCDFAALDDSLETRPEGFVVKPRHGAGSVDTFRVTNRAELAEAAAAFGSEVALDSVIVQPFVPGIPLSVAGIVSSRGIELWPVCRQRIVGGSRLHYAGGSAPARTGRDDAVADLARRTLAAVPGLFGYVGVDLLLPDGGEPVVVEINPRLTSSYHGYRRLAMHNLAERVVTPDSVRDAIGWRRGCVEFRPDGTSDMSR
ncbi:MAG TPA: ATP-grasp domain-containing protein, partial [Planctomycetaceae bacterium]